MNDIQISRLIFPNPHSTPNSVLSSCLPLKIMFFDRLKSFSTIPLPIISFFISLAGD